MKHYLLLISLFVAIGCKAENTPQKTQQYQENYHTPIAIGQHQFIAEIADTPQAMQQGMMYRPSIKDNQAMLFIFSKPQPMTFWMKNMQIPLDMLFFDKAGVLQEIKTDVPACQADPCPTYPAQNDNNQIVAEIKVGQAKKLGLTVGDRLQGLEGLSEGLTNDK